MNTNALLTDLTPEQEEKVSGGFFRSLFKEIKNGFTVIGTGGKWVLPQFRKGLTEALSQIAEESPRVTGFFRRLF